MRKGSLSYESGPFKHVFVRVFILALGSVLTLTTYAQQKLIDSLKQDKKNQTYCSKAWLETQTWLARSTTYINLPLATKQIDSVIYAPTSCLEQLDPSFSKHLLVKSWTYQGLGQLDTAITYALAARARAKKDTISKKAFWEITINLASMLVQQNHPGVIDSLKRWTYETQFIDGNNIMKSYLAMVHADYYLDRRDFTKAFNILNDALLAMPEASAKELAPILGKISGISHHTKNYTTAINIGQNLIKSENVNPLHKHIIRDQVGYSLLMVGLPDSALLYVQPNISTKAPSLLRTTQHLISNIHYRLGNLEKALHHIKIADSLYELTSGIGGHKLALIERAEIEDNLGLYAERDRTLDRHDQAKDNMNIGKLAYLVSRTKFKLMSEIENTTLEPIFRQYDSLRINQILENSSRQTAYLIEEFQTTKKEAQIERLNQRNEFIEKEAALRKRLLTGALVSTAALLCFALVLYRQRNQLKENGRAILRLNEDLEKENEKTIVLNTELNHRTANQLSLAYELILDQRRQIGDEQAKASLQKSESQLMALREVNRALANKSDDLVQADQVLQKVAENLQSASPYPFKLDLQLDAITIHGNAASRSALILSELMSNSIKYAFPNQEDAKATLSLQQSDRGISMTYVDNGPGKDGRTRGTGVGSELIEAMLEDMDAEFEEIAQDDGTGYGLRWWWG